MDMLGEIGKQLSLKAEQTRTPITGTFELSPICNLNCKMCYVRKNISEVNAYGGLLDVDFWYSKIEEASKEGMLFCLLTGGEPFLYPNFRELCERISKLPIYISINTNGTMLDEETVQWLKKIHVKRINISLYGASKKAYMNLCGDGNAFTRVYKAMKLLNRYQISYEVHTTLTPFNIDDYQGIIDLCNEVRTYLKISYYMYPPYRKNSQMIGCNKGRFTAEEAAKVAFRYYKDACQNIDEYIDYIKRTYKELMDPECIPMYGDRSMRCKAAVCAFWVDWRGNIAVCGVMEPGNTNLRSITFADGWNRIKQIRDKITISEKCTYCNKQRICPICAASAYCETGSVDGTPEYCCEFSEAYEKLIMEEYERMKHEGLL